VSIVAGLVPLAGLIGHSDSGFLYPDVQQQVCGNIVLSWIVLTSAVVLATRGRLPRAAARLQEP
jgi:hypothetical protein